MDAIEEGARKPED